MYIHPRSVSNLDDNITAHTQITIRVILFIFFILVRCLLIVVIICTYILARFLTWTTTYLHIFKSQLEWFFLFLFFYFSTVLTNCGYHMYIHPRSVSNLDDNIPAHIQITIRVIFYFFYFFYLGRCLLIVVIICTYIFARLLTWTTTYLHIFKSQLEWFFFYLFFYFSTVLTNCGYHMYIILARLLTWTTTYLHILKSQLEWYFHFYSIYFLFWILVVPTNCGYHRKIWKER